MNRGQLKTNIKGQLQKYIRKKTLVLKQLLVTNHNMFIGRRDVEALKKNFC